MANKGVAPYNPNTPVGQVRVGVGDTNWVPLNPPESGFGDYDYFSDEDIEAMLILTDGSIPRAIAMFYTQLAGAWNKESVSIRTDDLAYDNSKSVGNWLSLADYWNKIADDQEGEFAFVVSMGNKCGCGNEYTPKFCSCYAAPGLRGC